jgi:hypothetical protein
MARKKMFTPAQANSTLPLVRQIVQDIADLAQQLRGKHERQGRLLERFGESNAAHRDEIEQLETEMEQGQERMEELENELTQLGVLLKDYFTGLVDFPCWMDGREVYLCWRLGEPEVGHWHEIDAGFAGRQKLLTEARTK